MAVGWWTNDKFLTMATEAQRAARRRRRQNRKNRNKALKEMPKKNSMRKNQVQVSTRQREALNEGMKLARREVKAYMPLDKEEGMVLTSFLSMPAAGPPLRIPSQDMPLTAVYKSKYATSFTTWPTVGTEHVDTDTMCFYFIGQPGNMLTYGPVPVNTGKAQYYGYVMDFAITGPQGGLQAYSQWNLQSSGGAFLAVDQVWPVARIRGNNGYGMTDKPIGYANGRPHVFLSGGEVVQITTATGATGLDGQFVFGIDKVVTGLLTPVRVANVVATIASGSLVNTRLVEASKLGMGWYCVTLVSSTITGTVSATFGLMLNVTYDTDGALPYYVQVPAPELAVDQAIGSAVRRTAASLLISNTSAFNVRQGTVLAARAERYGPENMTQAIMAGLAQKYEGDAAKGCYTYLEFDDDAEKFREAVGQWGGLQCDIPNGQQFINTIWITTPGDVSVSNTYALQMDTVLEFLTDSQRYETNVPTLSFNELVAAKRIANATPWFFENPLHLSDIGKYIKSAWRFGLPLATRIAGVVAPQYGPLLRELQRLTI